jgi:hypothetical protein
MLLTPNLSLKLSERPHLIFLICDIVKLDTHRNKLVLYKKYFVVVTWEMINEFLGKARAAAGISKHNNCLIVLRICLACFPLRLDGHFFRIANN